VCPREDGEPLVPETFLRKYIGRSVVRTESPPQLGLRSFQHRQCHCDHQIHLSGVG
jgi:hypothetical protein